MFSKFTIQHPTVHEHRICSNNILAVINIKTHFPSTELDFSEEQCEIPGKQ